MVILNGAAYKPDTLPVFIIQAIAVNMPNTLTCQIQNLLWRSCPGLSVFQIIHFAAYHVAKTLAASIV
jgi:hypothetical protein